MSNRRISQTAPFVQCLHVSKSYPGGHEVFRDMSLRIERGELIFLAGSSGSGKSSFMKLLWGLEPIGHGHILIDGESLQDLRPKGLALLRRRFGMVPQGLQLLGNRSVFENVSLPLEAAGKDAVLTRRKVLQALRFVGAEQLERRTCLQLTGIEPHQVALARAIVNHPELVLADDPTCRLDPAEAAQVMELLMGVQMGGCTVIITTPQPPLPAEIGGARWLRIEQKCIVEKRPQADGTPWGEELWERCAVP